MGKIYTSVDIGTYSIKFIVGEIIDDKVYVLASHCIPSKGIKKGLIIEPDLVKNAIKDGINEVNDMLGICVKKVIVSIPDYNSKFTPVTGSVTINERVTSSDVTRVVKDSVYNRLEDGYELVTVLDIDYKVDGTQEISKPVGKNGQKLDFTGIMVSTPKKNIYSVLNVMEASGLEVVDITISGIADYFEVRNNDIDNKVGAVINLGHEKTTINVYDHGTLINNDVLQIGGINVEKDIAYVFGVSIFDGRTLKEKFASSHKRYCQISDTWDVKNTIGEVIKLNQLEVSEVVMSRMSEILNLCKRQIRSLIDQDIGYIILTGGLTEIKSFKNLAYDIFGKDVIVYSVTTLGIRDNKYCSAIGMIKYFSNKMDVRGKNFSMFSDEEELMLVSSNNKNKKDNVIINKLFSNFITGKEDK